MAVLFCAVCISSTLLFIHSWSRRQIFPRDRQQVIFPLPDCFFSSVLLFYLTDGKWRCSSSIVVSTLKMYVSVNYPSILKSWVLQVKNLDPKNKWITWIVASLTSLLKMTEHQAISAKVWRHRKCKLWSGSIIRDLNDRTGYQSLIKNSYFPLKMSVSSTLVHCRLSILVQRSVWVTGWLATATPNWTPTGQPLRLYVCVWWSLYF